MRLGGPRVRLGVVINDPPWTGFEPATYRLRRSVTDINIYARECGRVYRLANMHMHTYALGHLYTRFTFYLCQHQMRFRCAAMMDMLPLAFSTSSPRIHRLSTIFLVFHSFFYLLDSSLLIQLLLLLLFSYLWLSFMHLIYDCITIYSPWIMSLDYLCLILYILQITF